MMRPQRQHIVGIERLTLGCGCTVDQAIRPVKRRTTVCPNHDRRVELDA